MEAIHNEILAQIRSLLTDDLRKVDIKEFLQTKLPILTDNLFEELYAEAFKTLV